MDDILRLAFTFASNDDWKAPIRIGSTCKPWRALIDSTPAAWRLDKLNLIPAQHVTTWIAKSGNHRTFSLIIPETATLDWVEAIIPHRNRIARLRLHTFHEVLTQGFPMVKNLELFERRGTTMRSWLKMYSRDITPGLYPFLQSLFISSSVMCPNSMGPIPTPIPVTKLSLEAVNLISWSNLLIASAPTVVVLTLKALPWPPSTVRLPISFPRLVALTLSGNQLSLDLTTPCMTFLHMHDCHHLVLSSVNVSRVTSLILDTRITDPNHFFPITARVLIHPHTSGVLTFLRSLSKNPTNHFNLSQVAMPSESKIHDQAVEACRRRRITILWTEDTYALEEIWRSSHM